MTCCALRWIWRGPRYKLRDAKTPKGIREAEMMEYSHKVQACRRCRAITPHSLRRTWAMLAAQAGCDPKRISDQIGHTSAAFTLQVYRQPRHRRLTAEERQAIWELMRFADEPQECPLTHRTTSGR